MGNEQQKVLFVTKHRPESIPAGLRAIPELTVLVISGVQDSEKLFDGSCPVVVCCFTPLEAELQPCLESLKKSGAPILGIGRCRNQLAILTLDPCSSAVTFQSAIDLLSRLPIQVLTPETASIATFDIEDVATLFERAVNTRLPGSHERADRVVWLVVQISRQLNLAETLVHALSAASRMREIGKLGLPDDLLFVGRNSLIADKTRFYENYAALGACILRGIPALNDIASMIGYQLENVDGSGPAGLIHSQIPIGARILRVCAAYERHEAAIGAQNFDEVLSEMWKYSNVYYDPSVLAALDHVVSRRELHGTTLGTSIPISSFEPGMVLGQSIYNQAGIRLLAYGAQVSVSKVKVIIEQLRARGQNEVMVLLSVGGRPGDNTPPE